MPVRNVESQSPIERVPDVEREPGAAEHDKPNDPVKRRTRSHHRHKDTRDTWSHSQEGEEPQEETQEGPSTSSDSELDEESARRKLDQRA
jgi:hypothetical protein